MSDSMRRSYLLRQFHRRKATCVTVFVLGLIISIVLLSFLSFGEAEKPHASLLLVSALFRHGDRTPTETYPNDPFKASSTWPEGWGALTKKGKMQMYRLGKSMRARYDGFLSALYSPDDIIVLSSDNDRCLMSAETYMAGLFPPDELQKWHPDLNWQPIPIHATPRSLDKLIVVKKPCPKYDVDLKHAYDSPEITKLNIENAKLYDYLSEKVGQEMRNITAVEFLFNTLEIEESHGLNLPEWTESVYPDQLKPLAEKSLAIFTHTLDMKRSRGGPLIKQMAQNMAAKRSGSLKPNRKMFLYSGHDITIVNVWRALGFSELLKPNYGATLLVELHTTKQGSNHEVKVLYINDTTSDPYPLLVPSCGHPCFLDTFLDLVGPVMPLNWEKECELT